MNHTLVRRPLADIDQIFRAFWDDSATSAGFSPAVDVYRDDEDLIAKFDVPGVNSDDDVVVEAEGRRLIVHGERKDSREEGKDGRRFREVRFGAFRRVIALPRTVDADAISASYDAGVLTVRVAGAYAGTTPNRIEITKAA